ncbi:MAG: protein kinase domain-containing protein [Mycobacterium sp.]
MTTDPLVGTLLDGRYRVQARIATGGMSTVYRGLDVRLDRPVALKVMDARYAGDHQFLSRFHREARAVASLKHPGLVAIYDQGNDPAHPFLVMELIDGGTLRELLRERGPMPPHAVVAALRPVLGGLGVAHRSGLVHRDVKPENVLISDDGEVKLVDFGLVRAVAEAGITSTSVILGTAAYLSPEQVLGGDTGPRTDVYAAGVMAFELLTGATPFSGDNAITVANLRLDHDVPPPSSMIDGVPGQFDSFITRATARDPDGRFGDASAMAAELDAIAEELGLPKFRVPAPRNSAQHTAAAVAPPVQRPTRQLTRGPQDRQPVAASGDDAETELVHVDEPDESDSSPRQFAGINIEEFVWARQRARRVLTFWVLTVFVLTGLVALAGWELGVNINNVIGR